MEFKCIVPVIGNKPLINAIGSSEIECDVNFSMIDLTDEEINNVEFKTAIITLIED